MNKDIYAFRNLQIFIGIIITMLIIGKIIGSQLIDWNQEHQHKSTVRKNVS